MSATNKTTLLGLCQFVGSDSRKMNDYNSDMAKIDAQFLALQEGTDGTKVALATLATKAQQLQKPDATYAVAGTAAFLSVPSTVGAQAGVTEIVRGDDPRLSNERTPSNGSVSDTKIGNRTIDTSSMPNSDTGTLTGILGWLAAMIAAITGGASWRTVPVASIASLAGKFDASTGHTHTGAAGDAPQLGSSALSAGAGTDTVIGNRTIGDSTAPTADSGTITTLLSNIGYQLKAFGGGASWRAAPAMSLATLAGKFDMTNGHKHTGTAGDGPVLGSTALAAGAATDTVVGTRTITDATAPTNNAGTLTALFSYLAFMVKSITGAATWRTAPADTLANLRTDLDSVESSLVLTASKVVITNTNGKLTSSSVTPTALGYISGLTSDLQTQLGNKLTSTVSHTLYVQATQPTMNPNDIWIQTAS